MIEDVTEASPPTFSRSYAVYTRADGVAFSSDRHDFVLEGADAASLLAQVDGVATLAEVVARSGVEAERAWRLLLELSTAGYLESSGRRPERRPDPWTAGPSAPRAAPKGVHSLLEGDTPGAVLDALTAATGADGRLLLTADVLDPRIEAVDRSWTTQGRSWLLVKPVGDVLLVGPRFEAGRAPCWLCLKAAVRRSRPVRAEIEDSAFRPLPTSGPRPTEPAALDRLLRAWTRMSDRRTPTPTPTRVFLSLDVDGGEPRPHWLRVMAECPRCAPPPDGDPATIEQWDGRLESGWVGVLGPNRASEPVVPGVHVVEALSPVPRVEPRMSDLEDALTDKVYGKGRTRRDAVTRLVGEAVERYCGAWRPGVSELRATASALAERAVRPNEIALYSDRQLGRRAWWNAQPWSTSWVPDPFDPDDEIDWVRATSMVDRSVRWVPTELAYYGYRSSPGRRYARADSNGCAAGVTDDHALLGALLEAIERDAVGIWWYNGIRRPAIDLDALDDPLLQALRSRLKGLGRRVWMLDLTHDLEVPVCAAVSVADDDRPGSLRLGFAAGTTPARAVAGAAEELCQVLSAFGAFEGRAPPDTPLGQWLTDTTLASRPHLEPLEGRRSTPAPSGPEGSGEHDPGAHLGALLRGLEHRGLNAFAIRQARADILIPVYRVVVPGLRSFRPRFGPGRLYEVPVQLGWLSEPRSEAELDPWPCLC